jgi:hypothetical protein
VRPRPFGEMILRATSDALSQRAVVSNKNASISATPGEPFLNLTSDKRPRVTVPETRPRLADSDPAGCVADAIPRADATIHVSIVVKIPPYPSRSYARAEMYPSMSMGASQRARIRFRRAVVAARHRSRKTCPLPPSRAMASCLAAAFPALELPAEDKKPRWDIV